MTMPKENMQIRKMDWQLFWTAAFGILVLSLLIIGCIKSLSAEISRIEQRLSKLECSFQEPDRWESRKK